MSKPHWFPFHYDAWRDDVRVKQLTPAEHSAWLHILILSFPDGGYIPDSAVYVSNVTGMSVNIATRFLAKLQELTLLRPDGVKLYSPRMRKECDKLRHLYDKASLAGKASAQKRWGKVIPIHTDRNDRYNDRYTDPITEP